MNKFNNQFATQKLRQESNNSWPETITSRYRDEYLFIHDKDKPGFYNVQDVSTGKIVGRFGFNTPESAVKFAKDKIKPQGGRQSSGLGETSMTSAGAGMTPSTVNNPVTQDWYTTKNKKKPKKEGANIPKDFTDAPSIPNRPSKGGFIYKQLYEELSNFVNEVQGGLEIDDRVKVVYGNEFYGETGTITDIHRGFVTVEMDRDGEEYSMHSSDVKKIEGEEEDYYDEDEPVSDYSRYRKDPESYEKDYQKTGKTDFIQRRGLDESYSKFKNETKTRGKSDQFHQAVRQVKKKVLEINKMYEYVSRLKGELSEGEEGLKYKMHTEKALYQIKEMVSELNKKIKRFK